MIEKVISKINDYWNTYKNYRQKKDTKLRFKVNVLPLDAFQLVKTSFDEDSGTKYLFPKGTVVSYGGEDDYFYFVCIPGPVGRMWRVPKEKLEIIKE